MLPPRAAAPEERSLLFATEPADPQRTRTTRRVLIGFVLCFLLAAPFASVQLPQVDAFVSAYAGARIVIEMLAACLLLALYRSVGARSVLLLGCGYLFSSFMLLAHCASFPGVLTEGGMFGQSSQTTAWLYFFWHGGFSLVLLAYGLRRPERPEAVVRPAWREIAVASVAALLAAVLAVVVASLPDALPELMRGHADGPLKRTVAVVTWGLNAAALAAVLLRRSRSVLDLWVGMAAGAWLFDTGLAALLNQARFDFGWYAGRLYGLFAAGFVLAMLLLEYSRLYRRLVQDNVAIRRSSHAQVEVALASLSVAQRAASAGFWDWNLQTGKLAWSDELFRLFGLDPGRSEATFETWRRVLHPADLADAEARVAESIEFRIPLYNRYRIVRSDGAQRWIDAYGDVIRDADDVPVRMTGLCIDVSDRVAADEALRESEGKLRLFIDHAPSALAMFDDGMRYVAVSRRWMSDYRLVDSVIGRCHYDVFPDIPERWRAIHRRALAGEVISSEEDRFERADGTAHWLRWEVRPWFRANGSIGGMVAMSEDITERKLAQDALRESEARFRLLMEQAPDGIFVLDAQGRCVDINEAGAAMFGFDRSDLVGVTFRDKLSVAPGGRGYDEVWEGAQGRTLTCDWRFRRRDGSEFIGETVVRRLPDGGLQGVIRDITLRRRAESALRDSEYFYRQTLESIPGMVFTTRPDGYCDYQSQQWVEYTGVPMNRHQGDGWNALLHPDDRSAALAAWHAAVAGRGTYDLEYRVRRRDGVHEWFRVIGRPIRDADGRIVRWFGVAVNIEHLKQTEAQVAQHSRELEATLDAVPAMVYVKDARRRYTRVNAAVCGVLGLAPADVLGRSDAEVLPQGLAAAADESDAQVLQGRAPIKGVEETWHDAQGRQHWVSTSKSPFLDADGRIAGLVGVSVDITERKQAEAVRLAILERQRDALVREVHHRIKNHLQGVIGLLRYKSAETPEASARIELAIAQIASIAQVYGLQGRSHDAQLRLHELLDSIIQGAAGPVELQCPAELENIVLSQADAVPMALVINELLTNALKHLDRSRGEPRVAVRLVREADGVRVEIRGSPARLPSGFDYPARRGLGTGLELVSVLLPERRYRLRIEQEGEAVLAEVTLLPERSGIDARAA